VLSARYVFTGLVTKAGTSTASRSRRVLALVLGCLINGGVALAGVLGGTHSVVFGAAGLAPVVTAMLGAPAETAFVAIAASGIVFGSGIWEGTLADWTFYIRWAAVTLTGILAIVVAFERARRELARQRFDLLIRMSRIGNTIETAPDTAARIAALIVPLVADVAIFDVMRGATRRRLHVRAHGPRAEQIESFLRRHGPDQPLAIDPSGAELATGQPTLLEHVGDHELERWAQTPSERAELVRLLAANSLISVPLQARGELVGTLTLLVGAASGRKYDDEDLDFAAILGGRAALALEIAGLTRRMTQLELRLVSALGNLSDAISVFDPTGAVLYVSEAALQLVGVDSFEEFTSAGNLSALGFEIYTEDHAPATRDDLPLWRIIRGELEPPPMLLMRPSDISGEERWLRASSRPVRDASGQLRSVVEDVTESTRAELATRTLARASELLSTSLDYETVVERIAALAVERLADFCTVYLPDARGALRRVAAAGASSERGQRMLAQLERWPDSPGSDEGVASAFTEGRTRLMNDISDATLVAAADNPEELALWRQLGLTASLTVPLSAGGQPVGAMSLAIARPGRRFGDSDQALAEELGRRAGQALENARHYTTRSTIASTLQEALRPPQLVAPAGWELASWYAPAGDESMVGGDFYDVFPVTNGHVVLVGDVTGHGALAARLTGLARFTLRTAAELTHDPRTAIHRLDAALAAQPEVAPVSAICAHFADRREGVVEVRLAIAGHPLPLLIRDGQPRSVGRHGTVAGVSTGADWTETQVDLGPGDAIVFYTDGVTEARSAGELFGIARLTDALRGDGEPNAIVARVADALRRFQATAQSDDITLLALRCVGVPSEDDAHENAPPLRRRRVWALGRRR
jgi:serine phosphatase RsbU (regulator of sigma subunit)/PAS domain-containing protein